MDDLLGTAVMLSLPGYVMLQWYAARNWTGGWRVAAFVPLVVMSLLVVHAAIAFAAQSNLWPLLVILTAPLACLYLVVLFGARYLVR